MVDLQKLTWGEVRLSDIFEEINRGRVSALRNIENGKTVIIAASGNNEGLSCFADDEACSSNAMTISFNGFGTGTAFVHNYPFNLNSDCGLVVPKFPLSVNVLRFIAVSINMNKEKFNYGYKANEDRMLRQTILLPINEDGTPDYDTMEKYVSENEHIKIQEYIAYCKEQLTLLGNIKPILSLSKKEWKEFFVSEIFLPPKRGKRLTSAKYIDGNIPVVSSAGGNNGVIAFAGNKDNVRTYENCLSVANGGVSAGFAFYHPYKIIATDHVTHFKGDNLNKYHYLFLSVIIKNQMHNKYDFSREMTDPRLQREKLLVPVNDQGNPDFDYMEQYAKNTMIKKYNEYLEHIS